MGRLVIALKELVPDYSPSVHLLKRITAHDEHKRTPIANKVIFHAIECAFSLSETCVRSVGGIVK